MMMTIEYEIGDRELTGIITLRLTVEGLITYASIAKLNAKIIQSRVQEEGRGTE